MVNKVTLFIGLLLLPVCGNALVGPGLTSAHNALLATLTVPESGGLIVLGSLLISGATLLRRRRAMRRRGTR